MIKYIPDFLDSRLLPMAVFLAGALLFSSIIGGSIHYTMSNSKAYKVVETYISSSAEIENKFGKITDHDMAFKGHKIFVEGESGFAHFTTNISGTLDSGTILSRLKYKNGTWKIIETEFKSDK